jgi:hypothetical protein
MRLRELFGLSQLGLRLLTGEAQLDREIRWVHSTDLMDPSQYLGGGELILTSGLWRRSERDSDRFVAALNQAHTCALGFAVYVEGSTPPDLIKACERTGLPLFEVPNATPFVVISETVIQRSITQNSVAAERLHRLEHTLTSSLADGGGPTDLLAALADSYPGEYWAIDRCGVSLAAVGCAPSEADIRLVLDTAVRAETRHRCPPAPIHTSVGKLFPIRASGRPKHPPAGYLVHARVDPGWGRVERGAIDTVVEHLALALSHTTAVKSSETRFLREMLARVSAGAVSSAEAVSNLAGFGLRADDTCVVLIAGGPAAGEYDARLLLEMILQRLDASDVAADRVVLSSAAGTAVAIVPVKLWSGVPEKVEALLVQLADLFASLDFTIGMSAPPGPLHDLRRLFVQATHAELAARSRQQRPSFATSEHVGSHRLMLALTPPDIAVAFRASLIDPLATYDAQHTTFLVQTLERFLDTSCGWQRTADDLHIHVNTLRYRIDRIEQITNRRLSDMSDRVDLYLALQLHNMALAHHSPNSGAGSSLDNGSSYASAPTSSAQVHTVTPASRSVTASGLTSHA